MADPLEMSQIVLVRLGELLRKLPPDLVNELYEGTATLEVVPKGGRRPKQATATPALTVDAQQIETDLGSIDDRVAAARYVSDLKLTVPQMIALAKQLKITVRAKARRDEVIQEIVKWTVGKRLQSDAISRPPSRI